MGFVIPSATVEDLMAFRKAVKITTEHGAILPFFCMEVRENRQWQVPQHPIDTNTYIADTIWRHPIEVQLDGHVAAKALDRFKQLIDGSTEGKSGYWKSVLMNITGKWKKGAQGLLGLYKVQVLGGLYENMALTNYERTETPDENCGYAVSLTFQQVIQVIGTESQLTVENVASSGDSSTIDTGQTNLKKEPRNSDAWNITNKWTDGKGIINGIGAS